jgi:hypothetical protein
MSNLNDLFEDPSAKVEHFENTYARLKSSPDVEPPRRLMFEFEKPHKAAWISRWLAPLTASAAVAFAVVTLTPRPPAQPQIVERVIQQQVSAPAQAVDYQKTIDELRAELNKRDAAQAQEIRRVRGEVAALDNYQRMVERETWQNASQLLAMTTKGQE